jgi:hypothetical protein
MEEKSNLLITLSSIGLALTFFTGVVVIFLFRNNKCYDEIKLKR